MSEEDLELLITMDDPGEDTLEEDTSIFKLTNTTARRPSATSAAMLEHRIGGVPVNGEKDSLTGS